MSTKAAGHKNIYYHLIGWMSFIAYEVSFVTIIRWKTADISIWSAFVFPYLINISLFYFHAFVALAFSFGTPRKKPLLFCGFLIAELIAYLILINASDLNFAKFPGSFTAFIYPNRIIFVEHLWRFVYFLIFSTAFWLIRRSYKRIHKLKDAEKTALLKQQEKKDLEFKLMVTRNAFLQSQINPHLLFNTLNFINNEIHQLSPKASEAVICLADMMRYSLEATKKDGRVILAREAEQIANLIRINKFRFENKLFINEQYRGDFEAVRLIPLLLVTFVENIFKHGNFSDPVNPVVLNLWVDGQILYFQATNSKLKKVSLPSSGIGIQNVRTRLEAFYEGRYKLDIANSASVFSVSLTLKL
jgi:sensor histidine kinase YesM